MLRLNGQYNRGAASSEAARGSSNWYDFDGSKKPSITFTATLRQGQPVVGARLTATVLRPEGSTVTLPMVDNGDSTHCDTRANDGVDDRRSRGTSAASSLLQTEKELKG